MAYISHEAGLDEHPKRVDGFTPEQRFFISYGQGWCENYTPEILRLIAQTNPHSPVQYRVNGVVVNLPEFRKAFSCKVGTPMAPEKSCTVW
jgi:endothelin-converting enzyme/putative endopeptidase